MDNSNALNTTGSGFDLSNRFALDVQGFDALRAQAGTQSPQAIKAAAKQFDAVFTQMMLKSMREATPSDSPLDSHDGDSFTGMMDQQLAQQMSNKGIGVADAMLKQLMRNAGASSDASGSNAGNLAALNALGKAYGNAAANGSLSKDPVAYGDNSSLTPPLRGRGDSPKVDSFVDKLAVSAQQASNETGIPARFIIGQAALESGWGKKEIKNRDGSTSYNVFGIKATSDWSGKTVSTTTTEYINGQPHKVVEKFRAYDSYKDAMTDYANVLKSNPRYASVMSASRDAEGFAKGMQRAGYATDPHYAKKLMSIMSKIV